MADTYKTATFGHEVVAGSGGLSTVTTALAVCVADGASPTQAHVTTLNTAITAFQGGALTPKAAVFLNVDTTVVPDASVLRGILRGMVSQLIAAGLAQ